LAPGKSQEPSEGCGQLELSPGLVLQIHDRRISLAQIHEIFIPGAVVSEGQPLGPAIAQIP
jgi:hypothetical protein